MKIIIKYIFGYTAMCVYVGWGVFQHPKNPTLAIHDWIGAGFLLAKQ